MPKVTMFALSTCPWCRKAKRYFAERGVEYSCIDYDLADEETQKKVTAEMDSEKATGFPLVKIGDLFVHGYDPERYSELLGIDD